MYSMSKVLQQQRRESREKRNHDPLVIKCLRIMGMSRFSVLFEKVSFTQFIRMTLDREKLLDRIAGLCASASSTLDDFKPPGTLKSDKTHSTWVPENDVEFFTDEDLTMQHTDVALHAGNSDRTPLIRCREPFNVSEDENAQAFEFCSHYAGECDRYKSLEVDNLRLL